MLCNCHQVSHYMRGGGWLGVCVGGGVVGRTTTKSIPVQKKLLNKKIVGVMGKNIEQVLSTLQVLSFDVKKILPQAIARQKRHTQSKCEKKPSMPQKSQFVLESLRK